MSLPVTKTSYTQLTNALWFHSRFSLQMQRNPCRKKGYKQRRRLPLTVTTRDSEHKGRGYRPLRIVKGKKSKLTSDGPLCLCTTQSEAPGVITENGTRQTICKHMLYWQHQNPQTRNGSQSFQKAFRNNKGRKCHRRRRKRRRRRRSLDQKNEKMKTHDRRTTQDRSRKKTKKSSTIEKRYAKLKQNADTRFDTQIERQFVTQI